MVGGGVTSARAVESLSNHTGGHFGEALRFMTTVLNQGWFLHRALALYPEYFSELVVCLVEAGETGGMLDARLREIADFLEQSYEIRQRLVSQTVYPLVILHVAVFVPPLVVLVMQGAVAYAHVVVPRLIALYAVIALFFISGRSLSLSSGLRRGVDAVLLHIPLIGKVVRDGALMHSLRALGNLLEAGIPMSRAAEVSSRASGNAVVRSRLLAMEKTLEEGLPLSTALERTGVVSPMVMQMLLSGEESGVVGASIIKAADLLKVDFDNAVRRMASVVPALLILVVGGLVGYQYIQSFRAQFQQINQILP